MSGPFAFSTLRTRGGTLGLLLLAMLGASGCGDDDPSGPGNRTIASIQVRHGGSQPAGITLQAVGDTVHFTAVALDSEGDPIQGRTFTWTSSDDAVATVSATSTGGGEVRAVGPGSVTITAKSGTASGTATVEVDQVITSVAIEPQDLTLNAIDETGTLSATALDRNGHEVEGASFTWASSDEKKVVVSETGVVTAKGPGSSEVTATAGDAEGSATVLVAPTVASISVTPATATVDAGKTVKLTAKAFDASDNEIGGTTFTWSSADTDLATVDNNGLVTGVSAGKGVKITATAAGKSGSATIDVNPAPLATVEVTPAAALIKVGETRQLQAVVRDAAGKEVSGKTVTWSSANNSIATVSSTGLVTAVKVGGPIEITATAEGKSGSANISVITTAPPPETTMSPGNDYTCALNGSGHAYCWGKNADGQLGNGTMDDSRVPLPVQGGHTFVSISSGSSHVCALKSDGNVYCWGQNSSAQLGDGTMTRRTAPVAVGGALSFQTVSSGSAHSCALTPDGKAYCWGDNSEGQLGDGTRTGRPQPTAVAGGLQFSQISAGYGYTCATTTSNEGYCWGYNASGQLGNGSNSSSTTPTKVAGGLDFRAVEAGANFSCGITVADKAYCWGRNTDGQLGNGTTSQSSTPAAVTGGLAVSSLGLGVDHTCALTDDDAVYCWGKNLGLLGNGGTASSSSPVAVSGGHTFETLGVGRQHSCAVTPAGKAYCWGENANGQLGDGTATPRSTPAAVSGGQVFSLADLARHLFALVGYPGRLAMPGS